CCAVIGTWGPPLHNLPARPAFITRIGRSTIPRAGILARIRLCNDSPILHTLIAPKAQPIRPSFIPILPLSTPLPLPPLYRRLLLLIPRNRPKRRPELQPPRTRPPPRGRRRGRGESRVVPVPVDGIR